MAGRPLRIRGPGEKQLRDDAGCGQACLRMLEAEPPHELRDLFGPQMVKALRRARWRTSSRLVRCTDPAALPSFCVVKVIWAPRGERASGHWVVKDANVVYDPLGLRRPPWSKARGARVTGYIEILGRRLKRGRRGNTNG